MLICNCQRTGVYNRSHCCCRAYKDLLHTVFLFLLSPDSSPKLLAQHMHLNFRNFLTTGAKKNLSHYVLIQRIESNFQLLILFFFFFSQKRYKNCMQRTLWIPYIYAVPLPEGNYPHPCFIAFMWSPLTFFQLPLLTEIFLKWIHLLFAIWRSHSF